VLSHRVGDASGALLSFSFLKIKKANELKVRLSEQNSMVKIFLVRKVNKSVQNLVQFSFIRKLYKKKKNEAYLLILSYNGATRAHM